MTQSKAENSKLALGDGTTLNVVMIRSGYSSRILLINNVPMPEPVPPPRECASWKPCVFCIIRPWSRINHLKTVAALRLLARNVEHHVDELGALCVVALRPVVAGARLAEHEVVWAEELTEWTSAY